VNGLGTEGSQELRPVLAAGEHSNRIEIDLLGCPFEGSQDGCPGLCESELAIVDQELGHTERLEPAIDAGSCDLLVLGDRRRRCSAPGHPERIERFHPVVRTDRAGQPV
jgi:hypothetical protein